MAAQWGLLTDYLRGCGDDVVVDWPQLDAIVGGMPRSAIDHHPQWWHGDRPNTRSWRAAGYEAAQIRPGVSVRFVRVSGAHKPTSVVPPRSARGPASSTVAKTAVAGASSAPPDALGALDPKRCLIVIPCSKSKQAGGRAEAPTAAVPDLAAARRAVLNRPDSHSNESLVLPAWQRYTGRLYVAARAVIPDLAISHRLVIISGGYGVLDGEDLIGNYDRLMKSRDWPLGLLERILADRAAESGVDVVAFLGASTDYAKVLQRTRWRLPQGVAAHLVTIQGARGSGAISSSLGQALRAFVVGQDDFPAKTVVERLGS